MHAYQLEIQPATRVFGALPVPGDKSISHRYAMFGAMARGVTTVTHLAPGADVATTLACLRALGTEIDPAGPSSVRIHGRAPAGFRTPHAALDAANSGTTMRLMAGLLSGYPVHCAMTGDASLSRRPMRRVIDPLTAMGARISSNDGRAPLVIDGGSLTGITWDCPVPSAQVKSAVLLAGLRATGRTLVREPLSTRDHTERAFPAFGLHVTVGPRSASVEGGQEASAPALPLAVPGDPSSAAAWASAAAGLPGSDVRLDGICLNPYRLGFVGALERLGASVTITHHGDVAGEPVGSLRVVHGAHRTSRIGADEVPSLIDELPVLAARAALGGGLEVTGASELRHKESDRISALVAGFRALGADAHELPDGFVIDGSRRPTGGTADAAGDHRLVMAFAIVALGAAGPSVITGADAVAVSYPDFARDLARLTA